MSNSSNRSIRDIRCRIFLPMRELHRGQLARLTQIDYDREMLSLR